MISLIIFAVIVAGIAGIVVKFILDKVATDKNITWKEYGIGMAIISLILAPLVTIIGWNIAKSNNLTFYEYWNGWEKEAQWVKITCTRDGPCRYAYECDPYIVMVTYLCNCDSKGACQTCTRPETRYHSCPYCKEEWTFIVDTTLGSFTIAEHRLPENPQANQWRVSPWGIPKWVIDRAGAGVPSFWAAAKARINAGVPGPVTKRMQYENYILASEQTILKQYSSLVDEYQSLQLLPSVQSGIYDFYYADKVYFVGHAPKDAQEWQTALMYLNAALGTELQGDLHLVIVQNETISRNPDSYILALKAYWQNKAVFGTNAISKNSVIVVIGTKDGERIEWARAITGMPLGNEQMLVALRSQLKGILLTPATVLGSVKGEFYYKEADDGVKKLKVRGFHGNGVIERILWGLDDPRTKFARVSMKALDPEDVGGGFRYLESEIQPTDGQKGWIVFSTFVVSLGVWLAVALIGERSWKQARNYWRY